MTNTDIFITTIFNSFPLQFFNTNDINVDNLNANGQYAGMITKCDLIGNVQWRVKIEGVNSDETPMYMICDEESEFIYVLCEYNTDLKFYDVNDVLVSNIAAPLEQSTFVAQYSFDGIFNWVTKLTAGSICKPTDIILNGSNILIAVDFNNSLSLFNQSDLITNVGTVVSDGTQNISIIEYKSDGNVINRL